MYFVEDDKCVGERASTHVGEGGDLDDATFDELLCLFLADHVIHGVVEWGQVGEDLFLKLSGGSRGPLQLRLPAGEDDPFDAALKEVLKRHGHGKVGLTRACGADAKCDGVLGDGLEVALLIERLGHDALALELDHEGLAVDLAKFIAPVFGHASQRVVKIGGPNADALSASGFEELEEGLCPANCVRLTGDFDPVFAAGRLNAELVLGFVEVARVVTIKLAEVARVGKMQCLGRHSCWFVCL